MEQCISNTIQVDFEAFDTTIAKCASLLGRMDKKLPSHDNVPRRYIVRLPDGCTSEQHHNVLVPLELEGKPQATTPALENV